MTAKLSSRNWTGKASAGLLLGYAIAIALSGLIDLAAGPRSNGKMQFVMWMVPPVWCTILCLCFLFRDGRRAWLGLGVTAVALFGALWAGRALWPAV